MPPKQGAYPHPQRFRKEHVVSLTGAKPQTMRSPCCRASHWLKLSVSVGVSVCVWGVLGSNPHVDRGCTAETTADRCFLQQRSRCFTHTHTHTHRDMIVHVLTCTFFLWHTHIICVLRTVNFYSRALLVLGCLVFQGAETPFLVFSCQNENVTLDGFCYNLLLFASWKHKPDMSYLSLSLDFEKHRTPRNYLQYVCIHLIITLLVAIFWSPPTPEDNICF